MARDGLSKTGHHGEMGAMGVPLTEVRGLGVGENAISPSAFPTLSKSSDFRKLADEERERSGGGTGAASLLFRDIISVPTIWARQAVGCIAARMCNTNNCPAGIATQKPELRALLDIDAGARRLATFFEATVELMQILARACGHDHLSRFSQSDLTTWKKQMADLSGVAFGGVS